MPDSKWLHSLYQQAPVAIGIYIGPLHRIEFANPKMTELWDRSFDQVRHQPLFEILPEVAHQGFEEILAQVLQTGEPFSGEELPATLERRGKREQCYFNILYQPLRDEQGIIIGITQVATEVTKLVTARQQAQQQEDLLTKALSAAHMGSWQVDLVAGTSFRSQEFDRIMYGQVEPGREWNPNRFLSNIHPEDRAMAESHFQTGLSTGQLDYQARVQWPDHSIHWVRLQGEATFDLSHRPISFSGIVQDVTAHHLEAEEAAFRQSQRQALNDELAAANEELRAANEAIQASNEALLGSNQQLIGTQQALDRLNRELEARVDQRTRELRLAQAEADWQGKRLRDLFMEAPAAICILDGPELVFELINPGYQQLFPGRNLLGKPVLEALPEIVGQPIVDILREVYRTGTSFEGKEIRLSLARHQGEIPQERYFHFIYQARHQEQGRVDGILVFAYEITDQVLARRKVEDSQRQLRLITDALPVSIVYVDGAGRYQFANRTALEWRQQNGADIVGKSVEAVVGTATYQSVREYIERALSGERVRFEKLLHYPNGQYHTQTELVPHLEEGVVRGFYAMVTDISEQVMAHRKAEESAQRFRLLSESIPQIIWTATPDGQLDYFSQQWYDYSHYDYEQSKGQGWTSAIHPQDLPALSGHWRHSLQTGHPYQVEARVKGADDTYRWFLIRARPLLDQHQEITQWMGTCTDLHEQKEAEVQLYRLSQELATTNEELAVANEEIQSSNEELITSNEELATLNQQLAKVNADLDTFVYAASHDLKSPVTSLNALLGFLRKRLVGNLDEKGEEVLKMIENSSERLQRTIRDLTQVAKVQRSTEEERELVHFKDLLADIQGDLQTLIVESGARLSVELEEEAFYYTRQNARSILYNLLSNAIKYRSPVRLPEVSISTRSVDGRLLLTVRDNGLGLTASQQKNLFVMFKRFHNHVEGSGVGLYMIKRMVENNGGQIVVESRLGEGTTFVVHF